MRLGLDLVVVDFEHAALRAQVALEAAVSDQALGPVPLELLLQLLQNGFARGGILACLGRIAADHGAPGRRLSGLFAGGFPVLCLDILHLEFQRGLPRPRHRHRLERRGISQDSLLDLLAVAVPCAENEVPAARFDRREGLPADHAAFRDDTDGAEPEALLQPRGDPIQGFDVCGVPRPDFRGNGEAVPVGAPCRQPIACTAGENPCSCRAGSALSRPHHGSRARWCRRTPCRGRCRGPGARRTAPPRSSPWCSVD